MKTTLLFLATLLMLILCSSAVTTATPVTNTMKKERATAKFNQPMKLLGVELKGEYLFVHDDTAMARGESCTLVYKGTVESPDKLVLSFHCIPQSRTKAKHFVVRSKEALDGVNEIKEIQLAGSTEAHMVSTLPQHHVGVTGF